LKANSKKKLGEESGSKVGTFDEKKGGGKSHATVPLKKRRHQVFTEVLAEYEPEL
jgi:hypothetical protein